MKNALILITGLVLPVWGLTLHKRDNPAVVQMDIQRKDIVDPVARDQARRKRATVNQALDNEVSMKYYLGTSRGIRAIIYRHLYTQGMHKV